MIYIVDNFLDKKLLDFVTKDLKNFDKVDMPDKSFWIKEATPVFIDYIVQRLELIENKPIKNISGKFFTILSTIGTLAKGSNGFGIV